MAKLLNNFVFGLEKINERKEKLSLMTILIEVSGMPIASR